MEKRAASGWGGFGSFVIAVGFIAGWLIESWEIAIAGIGAGFFILLIASVIERLDDLISIQKEILKNQTPQSGLSPEIANTEKSKEKNG